MICWLIPEMAAAARAESGQACVGAKAQALGLYSTADWNWSSYVSNWYHMVCWHHKQQIYPYAMLLAPLPSIFFINIGQPGSLNARKTLEERQACWRDRTLWLHVYVYVKA